MKLTRIVRTVPLALLAVAAVSPLARAAVLVTQGFESSAADTYTYTTSSTGSNGTAAVVTASGGSSFPTSTPVASGTHGFLSYRVTTTTMNFAKVDLTGIPAAQVGLRLAALATVSTNGLDLSDSVKVYLSSGTGSFADSPASGTFSSTPDLTVTGNGNANWSYGTGTGVATNSTAGATFTPGSPGSSGVARTTDGYSTLQLSLPADSTYFFMQVVLTDDSTTEAWAIDDVTVSTPEPAMLGIAVIGGMVTLARRRSHR